MLFIYELKVDMKFEVTLQWYTPLMYLQRKINFHFKVNKICLKFNELLNQQNKKYTYGNPLKTVFSLSWHTQSFDGWKSFFSISRHRMNILIITDELMLLLFSNHLTVSLARDKPYETNVFWSFKFKEALWYIQKVL